MYCTDNLLMLKKTEFPLSLINSYALTFKQHYHGIGWQEYVRHHRIFCFIKKMKVYR